MVGGGFGPGCRGAAARPKPLCCDSIMEISSFPSQLHNLRGPYLHSSGRRLGVTGRSAAPHDCRAVLDFFFSQRSPPHLFGIGSTFAL